jgi:hypothetical protein
MRLLALLAVAGGLVCAGCGAGSSANDRPTADPGAFVRTLVRHLYRGETGAAWDDLHPFQQAKVSRERYIACERAAPLTGTVHRIDVVRVFAERATVPGKKGPEPSTAVTFRVLLSLPGIDGAQPITHTAHVFGVDGRWRWVIGPGDFPAYAAGTCPGAAPVQ